MKKCGRCKEFKEESDFYPDKSKKSGLNSYCKICSKIKQREYQARNYNRNKAKESKRHKIYYENNKEAFQLKNKIYHQNHKINKEEKAKYDHDRNIQNRLSMNVKHAIRNRNRRIYDLKFKLNEIMANAIRLALKGNKKGRSWEKLVGYSLNQLKRHLEKQFQPGMNWRNYGFYGWHIDHEIPISAFNFEKPEDMDFKKCWALSNLQPMWAKENIAKSNNLQKLFQPSLRF